MAVVACVHHGRPIAALYQQQNLVLLLPYCMVVMAAPCYCCNSSCCSVLPPAPCIAQLLHAKLTQSLNDPVLHG